MKMIDDLVKDGYVIDSDETPDTLLGCRVVRLSKIVKVTSRDPFGNATGEGERLWQKEIIIYPDGTHEVTTR